MKTGFETYLHKRVLVQLPMGFASGLPLLLTGSTLTAWMTKEGVSLKTIGFFAWAQLPYSFKFLWAPLLDRFRVPFLGRRRGWILVMQFLVMAGILALGFGDPRHDLRTVAAMAVGLTFFAATQDTLVDAYRTDLLTDEERAGGSAMYVLGYRIGMTIAGSLALILAPFVGWTAVYAIMAAAMLVGVVCTFLAPEPDDVRPPRTVFHAVVEPFVDFFKRQRLDGALIILAFVLLYRFGNAVLLQMSNPFLIKLGFALPEIGAINKGMAVIVTICGGLVAGGLVARYGIRRSLWWFGIIAALSQLTYAWLAVAGKVHWLLVFAIAADHFCMGIAVAPFDAYMMTVCNRRFSATQFALLTSFAGLVSRILGGWAGVLAERLGWPMFFVATAVMAVPGILIQRYLPVATGSPAPDSAAPPSS